MIFFSFCFALWNFYGIRDNETNLTLHCPYWSLTSQKISTLRVFVKTSNEFIYWRFRPLTAFSPSIFPPFHKANFPSRAAICNNGQNIWWNPTREQKEEGKKRGMIENRTPSWMDRAQFGMSWEHSLTFGQLTFFITLFFSRVHATLWPTMSVGRSVRLSVRPSVRINFSLAFSVVLHHFKSF